MTADIARVARARWRVQTDSFHALALKANRRRQNFGHGRAGLGDIPAVLGLFREGLPSRAMYNRSFLSAKGGCASEGGPTPEVRACLTHLTQTGDA